QIMEKMVHGDHPVLEIFRRQLSVAKVRAREFTGAGFYTDFAVPADAPRLIRPARSTLDDVHADVVGLEHGVGFVLFITDGTLRTLVFYFYGERGPDRALLALVYYTHRETPGNPHRAKPSDGVFRWALGGCKNHKMQSNTQCFTSLPSPAVPSSAVSA